MTTLYQLLEQLKTLLDDGYFDANNETDEDKLIDWLRTHITEMVKEAVGEYDKWDHGMSIYLKSLAEDKWYRGLTVDPSAHDLFVL